MPGMGPANAKKALDHFVASNYLWGSFEKYEPPTEARVAWKKFHELYVALNEPNREWRGQIHLVREWYKPHMERLYDHVHTRIGDLDQLELLSSQYQTRERFCTEITLDLGRATVTVSRPVMYRYADRVRGELRRDLNVVPAVTVGVDAKFLIVPVGTTTNQQRLVVRALSYSPAAVSGARAPPISSRTTRAR